MLNINVPNLDLAAIRAARADGLGQDSISDLLLTRHGASIRIRRVERSEGFLDGTDVSLVHAGCIAVSELTPPGVPLAGVDAAAAMWDALRG